MINQGDKRRRGIGGTLDNRKWTEKILTLRKIGDEPPLNKEGFWKKRKPVEPVINKDALE